MIFSENPQFAAWFTINPLFHDFTLIQLCCLRIDYDSTYWSPKKLWKHYSLLWFKIPRRSTLLWIDYDSNICFTIHYDYFGPQFTMNHFLFHESTIDSPLIREIDYESLLCSRNHFKSTAYFANILWIHYLFRELTVNSPPILRIYCGFTIFFANRKRIYYLQRELSVNSLSVLRFNCEFTIYFAN